MKKFLFIMALAGLMLALVVGCGQKAEETDKAPAEVKVEEMKDTTRMDSAAADTMMEETEEAMEEHGADDGHGH